MSDAHLIRAVSDTHAHRHRWSFSWPAHLPRAIALIDHASGHGTGSLRVSTQSVDETKAVHVFRADLARADRAC